MAVATKEKKKEVGISEVERPIHKVKPGKVKVDDLMSITHFVKVARTSYGGDRLSVTGLDEGVDSFEINGSVLVENMSSAEQFHEERTITQTDLIGILMSSYRIPFTVCYDKENGEERILRGRLIEPDGYRGRSKCEDLDEPRGKRFRLVDHRTLKWMIVSGVKYSAR